MSRHAPGIFNPPDPAANVGESRDSDKSRVANGSKCDWCGGTGLVARFGIGKWGWGLFGPYRLPKTRAATWREGGLRKEIRRCVCATLLAPTPPVGESPNSGDGWVAGGTSAVDRLLAACPPPDRALDLARFARDAAWDAAEQAVRRELIARRRYLPQFVGAVRA